MECFGHLLIIQPQYRKFCMNPQKLTILYVEDEVLDVVLIRETMAQSDYVCEIIQVETEKDFREKINTENIDIVLCDYNLPHFDGLTALQILQEKHAHIPFIIISGKLGEEIAVDILKKGATDYIFKNRLSRLIPSIKRAMKEKEEERKKEKMQRELQMSQQKYLDLYDNAPDIYITTLSNGKISSINKFGLEILGYEHQDLLGKYIWEVIYEKDIAEVKNIFQAKYSQYEWDCRIRTKDKNILWIHSSLRFFQNEENHTNEFLVISRDITRRKEMEEEKKELQNKLVNAQKMEALGLLAGGVAHDLNNILSGIVTYPDIILLDPNLSDEIREGVEIMQNAGKRAAAIVQDLLTSSRRGVFHKEVLSMNNLVEDYLSSPEFKIFKQQYPHINIIQKLEQKLLPIYGSSLHIRKAIMNLIINAFEAIKTNGEITISTHNKYIDTPLKKYETIAMGEYATLCIHDTGEGLSLQDMQRIFEPFYTKKVMGRSGTGLGLAIVWNTIRDHNGYIDIKSNRSGTQFELFFPLTRRELKEQIDDKTTLDDMRGNGQKILIVDDEDIQRKILKQLLVRLNYTVSLVENGEQAIAYLKTHTADLLILDMIMPQGINGRGTYEEIVKDNPHQKAIIVSGFAETEEVKKAQFLGAKQFIKKPYILKNIAIAIKKELE